MEGQSNGEAFDDQSISRDLVLSQSGNRCSTSIILCLPSLNTSRISQAFDMKVAAVTFAFFSLASATCWSGQFAAVWPSRNNPRYHAGRACRGYDGNRGAFQGVFGPSETKSVCVNSDANSGMRYRFSIQNLNGGQGFDLNDEDCLKRLADEIDGCAQGGSSDISGWRFA